MSALAGERTHRLGLFLRQPLGQLDCLRFAIFLLQRFNSPPGDRVFVAFQPVHHFLAADETGQFSTGDFSLAWSVDMASNALTNQGVGNPGHIDGVAQPILKP